MNEFLGSEVLYKKVEELRLSRGWSIYQLAKRANVTENSIYRWRDRKSSPTLYLLESLCGAFEISIVQLLMNDSQFADLTREQQDLINRWSTLKDQEKRAILEMIKAFQRNGEP